MYTAADILLVGLACGVMGAFWGVILHMWVRASSCWPKDHSPRERLLSEHRPVGRGGCE